MEEIWKDIIGYNGKYQVSNLGRIKSFPNKTNNRIRFIQTKESIYGEVRYPRVFLCLNAVNKRVSIHRLVAEYFIPNPENKGCVNHKNGVKTDNRAENLEWVTNQENMAHAFATGLCGTGVLHWAARSIIQMDMNGVEIKTWAYMNLAVKALKIPQGSISRCLAGQRRSTHGFKWKYADKE